MNSLCVYCGSSTGARPDYVNAGQALARVLSEHGLTMVYGGAHVGIMGAIADELLSLGGKVIGVIPRALVDLEVAHEGLSELHVVEDMHERKAMMATLSDGFIALPGGIGTLEETFEALTWLQLGFHEKPCGVLNVAGFYDQLLSFLDHACEEQFMRPEHRHLLLADADAGDLVTRLKNYEHKPASKVPDDWMPKTKT